MIYLLMSIVCNTYLVLMFQVFKRLGIPSLPAIIINYFTCVATGILFYGRLPELAVLLHAPWLWIALVLGCSFVFFFNLMAWITTHIGMTVTSVAGKISMVIPVCAAIVLYGDRPGGWQVLALLLAFPAVVCSSLKKEKTPEAPRIYLLAPLLLFVGSGMNDTLVKYAETQQLPAQDFPLFNMVMFTAAFFAGSLFFVVKRKTASTPLSGKLLLGGVLLGIPNFLSMQFLLLALNRAGWKSSVVFPLNNVGIVLLTALSAYLLFKEKLSPLNLTGLLLSVVCITLMLWGGM